MVEKRSRAADEEEEQEQCLKRFRGWQEEEQQINRLLLEEEERLAVGSEVQEELLSGVIRSLEEEINLPSASSSPRSTTELHRPALPLDSRVSSQFSYLLEASDDELGIALCCSPALSEADLSCSSDRCSSAAALDFLEGEVINLEFPEFEDSGEWLKRAVVTLDLVVDASQPLVACSTGPGFDSQPPQQQQQQQQQVLVEAPGFLL